jgi:Enoyl-(Acyl carrier protein) reductase
VALNLLAPFYLSQAANAVMQQQDGGGSIINIGSVSAHQAAPLSAAYSAAKAGLVQLTRSLALEWAPKVRVNHITAGLVMTEDAAQHYGQDGGASVARAIPMGRMAAPADVASACLLLASPLACYVTGADLAVHGGGEMPEPSACQSRRPARRARRRSLAPASHAGRLATCAAAVSDGHGRHRQVSVSQPAHIYFVWWRHSGHIGQQND